MKTDDLFYNVVNQIKLDLMNGDCTAIDELLGLLPYENLYGFISEFNRKDLPKPYGITISYGRGVEWFYYEDKETCYKAFEQFKIDEDDIHVYNIIFLHGELEYEVIDSYWSEEECDTSKEPIWIGVELNTLGVGDINVCIGINQEGGHEVSFYGCGDYEAYKTQDGVKSPWCYDYSSVVVSYGKDGRVFDDDHKLIK